jgi:hypothetical protein
MCPACLTSLGFIAAGSGFSGGLAIVVARSVRRMAAAKDRSGMEPTETSGNDRGEPSRVQSVVEERS